MSDKFIKPYKKGRVVIDKKYSMIIYAVTLVIAVICRTDQLKSNMDFQTGKYIENKPDIPLIVIIIGFILLAAIMIFGESRDKAIKSCILINPMRLRADRLNKKVSPKAAASMFIMSALIAYDALAPIMATMSYNIDISTEDNPVPLFRGTTLMQWISFAFVVVLSITFIITGVNILKGEGISKGNCFFLAAFPIWKLLHIFMFITKYQVIGPYSEKCYILFTDIFSSMFFLYMVRFFCGFERKGTRTLMIMFGYMASVVAAVSVLPRYVMYFILDYSVRDGMLAPELCDIGIIFVTVTVVAVFWSTYVYRIMPRLNLGKRRWAGIQVETEGTMKSIDED